MCGGPMIPQHLIQPITLQLIYHGIHGQTVRNRLAHRPPFNKFGHPNILKGEPSALVR